MISQPPALALHHEQRPTAGPGRGIGLTIISFNTARQTLRCLESLGTLTEFPDWVFVLDNASETKDFRTLESGFKALSGSNLRLYRSETNLGFAAGSNFLIEQLMLLDECQFIGLLNNDAVAMPRAITSLVDLLESEGRPMGMAGGRMHKLHMPDEVDTLGIALYASLMPADRKSITDPFMGPTGGCCILARPLIEDLLTTSGYCFDARYFCYCEDTDLVLRAVMLGWQAAYCNDVVALHEGQASTGGGYSPFITYHGIRNAIWMHAKLMPTRILLRHGLLLFAAHALTVLRHVLSGHPRLILRAYSDALAHWSEMRQEHHRFMRSVRISPAQLRARLAPGFYRTGYLRQVLLQLVARLRPSRWSR